MINRKPKEFIEQQLGFIEASLVSIQAWIDDVSDTCVEEEYNDVGIDLVQFESGIEKMLIATKSIKSDYE